MPVLSHHRGERALQKYVVTLLGWVVVAIALAPSILDNPSGSEESRPVGLVGLRAGLGVVVSLLRLWLAALVQGNRDEIAGAAGLKRQYLTACMVTAVVGVLVIFFWWTGLAATAVGLVSRVLVAGIRTVSREQMTEQVDYDRPESWGASRHPLVTFGLALLGSVVLVAVLLVVLFIAYG